MVSESIRLMRLEIYCFYRLFIKYSLPPKTYKGNFSFSRRCFCNETYNYEAIQVQWSEAWCYCRTYPWSISRIRSELRDYSTGLWPTDNLKVTLFQTHSTAHQLKACPFNQQLF